MAVARLRKQLPEDTQAVLRECNIVGDTSSEKYKATKFEYYKRFLCRLVPMPEPILFSFQQSQKSPTVLAAI
jgi:L-proline amide hydrolase